MPLLPAAKVILAFTAAHACAPPHAQHIRSICSHRLAPPRSPPSWHVAGSGISAAPQPNGYALVLSLRRLNLPAVSSDATFATAWRCLKQRSKQLPDGLRVFSPCQHAMLAFLCDEWTRERSRLSAEEFIMQTFRGKLYPEVRWLSSHRIGWQQQDLAQVMWGRACGWVAHGLVWV